MSEKKFHVDLTADEGDYLDDLLREVVIPRARFSRMEIQLLDPLLRNGTP